MIFFNLENYSNVEIIEIYYKKIQCFTNENILLLLFNYSVLHFQSDLLKIIKLCNLLNVNEITFSLPYFF